MRLRSRVAARRAIALRRAPRPAKDRGPRASSFQVPSSCLLFARPPVFSDAPNLTELRPPRVPLAGLVPAGEVQLGRRRCRNPV
jgi:hypothetical protein